MDVRTWRKKTKGKVDKAKGKVDKIFGNDKGCFEVRLAKLSDGSKVLTGLGGNPSDPADCFTSRIPNEMVNVGAQLRVAELQANDVVTPLFPLHDP